MNIDRASHAGVRKMELEVDRTLDSLDYVVSRERRKSHRRYSKTIRSQQEEDEERQKILLEALHSGISKKGAEKDKEKAMRTAESIKTALAKAKQLAARAFKEDIIDQLSSAVEEQPLFHAGTMLDASARVYSFRVDVTHSEACDVRMKLGDPAALNRAEGGEKQTGKRQDEETVSSSSDSSDVGKELDGLGDDVANAEKLVVRKEGHKNRGIKEGSDIEEDAYDEAVSRSMQDAFDAGDLPTFMVEPDADNDSDSEETTLSTEQLIEKFKKKADSTHAMCLRRRSKVAMVVVDTSDLDDREGSSQFCDHLYSKATHNFDEGSTSGLLMQNAAVGKRGRRLLLHNDLRCPPDPPHEKIDADDLLPFYGVIGDIEKAEPLESVTVFGEDDPSISLVTDLTVQMDETQAVAGLRASTTFVVETSLSEPARSALMRTIKELLGKSSPYSPKGALMLGRMRLQKKFGISSRKFARILESCLKGIEPTLYGSLARCMLTPPGSHSYSLYARSAETESWISNAVVADELELFEQCFDWVVNSMSVLRELRWEMMKNAKRAAMLKSLPCEDPDYNYFFARGSECPFPVEEDGDAEEDACFWRSEVAVRSEEGKVTEADYMALAQVLANFKVVKGASLFTRKGDALNRTLAAIPILTTARERIRQLALDLQTVPPTSVSARRIDEDEMAAAGILPVIGLVEEFSGDLDDLDDGMLADEDAVPANQSAMEGVQALIANEDASPTADPEVIAADGASPSTAVGDLHFLDENVLLQTVSSLISDGAHWKAKPSVETTNVTQKQVEAEAKKKERAKERKEQGAKQIFEWGDEDDLPLSALRDRMANAKRPAALCRSEDEILTAASARKISMQLYMPHHFCKLSHIFVGEWGKLRINRASSAPLETPHEGRWIDGVIRDMQTNDQPTAGKSFMEFLSIFNGYFNSADERNVRAGSEPYLGGSSGDFEGDVPTEDDDDLDNANTFPSKPLGSVLDRNNRSFFSEADSDVEDAEMFGVKYSIRQRRINAPAVKRAIGTVLSNKELDADMLNVQLQLARRLKLDETVKLGDRDVSIVSERGDLDLSLVESRSNGLLDMSAEEEELQMREEKEMGEDPTCELHKSDVKVSNVMLSGRHTFSSLLVRVPDYLTGRTANDLNPINAFSVLLHMCNENNLELAQRRDDNNMVLPSAMGDFTILRSRRNKRKHQ